MNFTTLPVFFETVPENARVTFLIRHAERRHILPEDANYGELVPITEIGFKAAQKAGALIPKTDSSSYISSPVFRCRQTASAIASGMGDSKFSEPEQIAVDKLLAEFFVKDHQAYEESLQKGFYESICEYLKTGHYKAYKDIETGSLEMLELLKKYTTAKWNFAITHDAWIVPCLQYFCGITCTPQKWLNFMSGIAFVFEGEGYKAVPITFMDSGFLLFTGR